MFISEAVWINKILKNCALSENTQFYDIGSCSEEYRCLEQPYMDFYVYKFLREKNVPVKRIDCDPNYSAEILLDIAQENIDSAHPLYEKADIVLASNILEHVTQRTQAVHNIWNITKPGGLIIVTVPHKFPYHAHPIDTMFRPNVTELIELFQPRKFTPMDATIIQSEYRLSYVNLFLRIINKLFRVFNIHRRIELLDTQLFEATCVVLRKIN